MNIINAAARIIRAGDKNSEANKKLREAVKGFILWLSYRTAQNPIPPNTGWELIGGGELVMVKCALENGEHIELAYRNIDRYEMDIIQKFCGALAGPEGVKLATWFESQTKQNEKFLGNIEDFKRQPST